MTIREKLITLLNNFQHRYGNEIFVVNGAEILADHLIANGVTVNKWISVKERMPESEKIVLVSAVSKQFGYRHTLMAAHIGHHEVTTEDWREYEGDTEYDEENDCFWIPECWWESNAIEDNGNWIIDGDYDVTHWMPLPSLPKGEGL